MVDCVGAGYFRHAQSVGNATGNYSLLESDSLTEIGRQQAIGLSRRTGRRIPNITKHP